MKIMLALIVFLVAVIWLLAVRHNRRKAWQFERRQAMHAAQDAVYQHQLKQRLVRLLELAEAGNFDAFQRHSNFFGLDINSDLNRRFLAYQCGLGSLYDKVYDLREDHLEYVSSTSSIRQHIENWKEARDKNYTYDMICAAENLARDWKYSRSNNQLRWSEEFGFVYSDMFGDLQVAVEANYAALMQKSQSSAEAFFELRKLLQSIRPGSTAHQYGLAQSLDYPAHWNDWVIRYITAPSRTDFVGVIAFGNRPSQHWLLKAAEAKENQDVKQALILISVCSEVSEVRHELSILLADLAVLVAKARQPIGDPH
jgi:hypothetical protein